MIEKEISSFRLGDFSKSETGCFESYLIKDAIQTRKLLPGELALEDSLIFKDNIENFVDLLETSLSDKRRTCSFLALGKIQSGKTAHMLGVISWAADSSVAITSILTGITDDLNKQTMNRLKSTFDTMDGEYIEVLNIPTSTDSKEYKALLSKVIDMVEVRLNRRGSKLNGPLPVLTSLKTVPRIETLRELHRELLEKFGPELISLILDDEADQASQNSGAQKRKSTAIYQAISSVRNVQMRNFYIAYTATPQAVLLTDRKGELRPDYCLLIKPRKNYFGLRAINSFDYRSNLELVDDFLGKSSSFSEIPESLKNSIFDFFFNSLIKFQFSEVFYRESGLGIAALEVFPDNTQMLIHESSLTSLHSSMHLLVKNEIDAINHDLEKYSSASLGYDEAIALKSELQASWNLILNRLPKDLANLLPATISQEMILQLKELVSDTEVIVVNSAKNRPNKDVAFPSNKAGWSLHKCWILIGGDILGRGLTIPQLLTTYFLRNSKIPNFDTVSQQMRFCGYRQGYKSFTSIWAPDSTFRSFSYMNEVENIIWNRAKKWDEERIQIRHDMPKVFYASPMGTNMEPTRKSVRDPELLDLRIKNEVIFEASRIFDPKFFKANLTMIRRWIADLEDQMTKRSKWFVIEDLNDHDLHNLLTSWECTNAEKSKLLGVNELFSADLESLGLSEVPRSVFISSEVLEFPPIRDLRDIESLCKEVKSYRTISNKGSFFSLQDWWNSLESGMQNPQINEASITHIGGSLRKIKNEMDFDGTLIFVEFVRGKTADMDKSKSVGIGITLTILAPSNYEVRMIGHS